MTALPEFPTQILDNIFAAALDCASPPSSWRTFPPWDGRSPLPRKPVDPPGIDETLQREQERRVHKTIRTLAPRVHRKWMFRRNITAYTAAPVWARRLEHLETEYQRKVKTTRRFRNIRFGMKPCLPVPFEDSFDGYEFQQLLETMSACNRWYCKSK